MKKIVYILCLGTMIIGMGGIAQAQFRQSIYLNGNIPTGDFGKSTAGGPNLNAMTFTPSSMVTYPTTGIPLTVEEVGKDAIVGFGLGYRVSYRFDVGMGLVAPFANVDFLWNTIDGKWSDKYSDEYWSSPTYFNIPLMAGVTYIYDELPLREVSAYGEFGLGTDLFCITSEGKGKGNERFAYKPTFAFAWMIGAGAYFGQHVSVGLYYYGLGKHTIDYTQGTLDDNEYAEEHNKELSGRQRRSVGSVMLRIGFHF